MARSWSISRLWVPHSSESAFPVEESLKKSFVLFKIHVKIFEDWSEYLHLSLNLTWNGIIWDRTLFPHLVLQALEAVLYKQLIYKLIMKTILIKLNFLSQVMLLNYKFLPSNLLKKICSSPFSFSSRILVFPVNERTLKLGELIVIVLTVLNLAPVVYTFLSDSLII